MADSPTQHTLKYLRDSGWIADVTERWVSFGKPKPGAKPKAGKPGMSGVRKDLFGFGDIAAYRPDVSGVLIVQATSTPNMSARIAKLLANDNARKWVSQPWRAIAVVGWRRYAKAVKRKYVRPTWRCIALEDFEVAAQEAAAAGTATEPR